MLFKTVIYFTLCAVLSVNSQCDQGCQKLRIKRGKYYSNAPIRFYNQPPVSAPIEGPFSYTPPPFMVKDKPPYPGGRPYKVSNPISTPSNNDGLDDADLANIIKYMSKQDLDKIVEMVQGKDYNYYKYKDTYNTNEYGRPHKRENKIPYKGNSPVKYEKPTSYKEGLDFLSFVTDPNYATFFNAQETQDAKATQVQPDTFPTAQRIPNEIISSDQAYINSDFPPSFSTPSKKPNTESQPTYFNLFEAQEPQRMQSQVETERYKPYKTHENPEKPVPYPVSNNPFFIETNEEEKLPPPENMREEDYEVAYTNKVPKVVKAGSYDVENFGDLPLMDYNSKLHDVSSYHVPHYTITQPKPPRPQLPPAAVSFPSSASHSSSSTSLLKPSPAAADILEPIYEPAPPVSAAVQQSDAHLKATKIWSYKSRGAAYVLHDDGSLSPERSRPK